MSPCDRDAAVMAWEGPGLDVLVVVVVVVMVVVVVVMVSHSFRHNMKSKV